MKTISKKKKRPVRPVTHAAAPKNIETDKKEWLAAFAKALLAQRFNDPSGKTSRRQTTSFGDDYKENIEEWLHNPSSNEQNLRKASVWIYQSSNRYRSLLNYFANIPLYYYVITAVNYNPDKTKSASFEKQYRKVCSFLETMKVAKTMKEIVLCALREGVYYGVRWGKDGNSYFQQKLDPDKCTIVSMSDGGVFDFVYDMSTVKEADLEASYYPQEFKEMYKNYTVTGNKYQLVPPEISVCFKADPTIPEYSIPMFSSVLPTLLSLQKTAELSMSSDERDNYKLLAAKIPTDDEGTPMISYDDAMEYYNHISANLDDLIGLCMTPFDIKDFSFEKSGTSAQVDMVSKATKNFFEAAGTSPLAHGVGGSSSSVTKLAIKADEGFSLRFLDQCESIINRMLKNMSGTTKFKVTFLPITIYNREEMIAKYKEALNYGVAKLEYIASLGIPQMDIQNKSYIENDLLSLQDILLPLKTASTQSVSSDESKAGRPEESDDELDDTGEATRESESNENRSE